MKNTPISVLPAEKASCGQVRNVTLDVLKGIGIILMVIGHSGSPFHRFIYLFHMALFFMASGYLWNDKKVADLPTLGKSLLSRIRGLWLPYTIANGCFTLLNNPFVHLGIYSKDKLMTLPQIAVNLCKNLFLAGDTTMGGISWFLRCLFFVSVGHLLVRYIATHWKGGKVFFWIVVVLVFAGAEVINRTGWKLPMSIETCFCGYSAFLMGMALRKLRLTDRFGKFQWLVSLGALVVLLVLCQFDNIGMGAGNISSLPFFITASVSGWLLVWGVSALIKGSVAKILSYCGQKSIWIALLHFLAFKPVAWLYLVITEGNMVNLSSFPVYAVPWLWIAYTISGTALPLLFCAGIQAVIKCIFKKK